MELTAVLTPADEGGYIALNPETGTTTQSETAGEALSNLQEATALYLSEFPFRRAKPSVGHGDEGSPSERFEPPLKTAHLTYRFKVPK